MYICMCWNRAVRTGPQPTHGPLPVLSNFLLVSPHLPSYTLLKMSTASRFTSSYKTTQEGVSGNTVGLTSLDDFRKRRAEVIAEQEREAREAALLGNATPPNRSLTSTPANASERSTTDLPRKKKKKRLVKLSFGQDDEEGDGDVNELPGTPATEKKNCKGVGDKNGNGRDNGGVDQEAEPDISLSNCKNNKHISKNNQNTQKLAANASVGIVPKAITKSALRKQAAEREALRREFMALQSRVKETEIAIPFVFYDGVDVPGGTVRVKKGDFVWFFLDKSRKVGAELRYGRERKALRGWARVSVDDLMMVRGGLIIPHVSSCSRILAPNTTGYATRLGKMCSDLCAY